MLEENKTKNFMGTWVANRKVFGSQVVFVKPSLHVTYTHPPQTQRLSLLFLILNLNLLFLSIFFSVYSLDGTSMIDHLNPVSVSLNTIS